MLTFCCFSYASVCTQLGLGSSVMMLEMYKVAPRQCIIRQKAQVLCNQVLCDIWPHQRFILLLDSRGQLVEKVILCGNHSSGDLTLLPKDSRQLHRWLIGINEDGIFINPALLAREELVVAAPHAYSGEASTCSSVIVRPWAQAVVNSCSPR